MTRTLWSLCFLFVAVSAGAQPVYKCEEGGIVTYTDRPCSADAREAVLPALIVTAPPGPTEQARARAHDARIERTRAARDADDARWLAEHARGKDRDARVRKAMLEHRVIKGMTTDEVRQALGAPDRVAGGESFGSEKETWTYEDADGTRTVNFKKGEVTTTHARRRSRR